MQSMQASQSKNNKSRWCPQLFSVKGNTIMIVDVFTVCPSAYQTCLPCFHQCPLRHWYSSLHFVCSHFLTQNTSTATCTLLPPPPERKNNIFHDSQAPVFMAIQGHQFSCGGRAGPGANTNDWFTAVWGSKARHRQYSLLAHTDRISIRSSLLVLQVRFMATHTTGMYGSGDCSVGFKGSLFV